MFNGRLIKIVLEDRPALAAFLVTILCSAASGALIVLQAVHLSQVIQRAYLEHSSITPLIPLLRMLLWIIAARAVLTVIKETSATYSALRLKDHLRTRLLQHLTALGPILLRRERTGELTNTVLEGVEALEPYMRDYLPQVITAIVVPLTILMVIFPIDWISGLILFFTAPLIPLFLVLIGGLANTFSRQQWQALSRMSAHYFDVLQGLTTLKIFNQSRPQTQKIAEIGEEHRRITMHVLRVAFLSAFSLEFLATLSTAVVAVGVGLRLLYGHLDFGDALCVLFLAPDFYMPLRLLGSRFHSATAGLSAAERIFALIDIPCPQPIKTFSSQTHSTTIPGRPREIRFEEVGYSYIQDDQRGLKDVSFAWLIGEKIALVGPTGAGKSTLTNLLLRFIRPMHGCVHVDGVNLEEIDLTTWRSRIAWIPQNPYLFNASVEENIRLTKSDASLEEIQNAAILARADDFIQALPQGYQTPIGERGLSLSAGQAQRLALARALLKDDPWLLILDEASANLDPQLQSLTSDALDLGWADRFTLTVAHRLSSAAKSDRVIVLEGGNLIQQGTHRDLSESDGLYRQMILSGVTQEASVAVKSMATPPAERLQDIAKPKMAMTFLSGEDGHAQKPPLHRSLLFPFLLSLVLGLSAILSNIGLMGTSAYIISAAALHPSVADLQVAIVAVRFFGIVRAVFRYLERYVSHRVTLGILTRLRIWFYRDLEPLAPARLLGFQRADLLARIVGDINSLETFYVRVLYPPLVAVLTALIAGLFLQRFYPDLGTWLVLWMAMAGVLTPILMYVLGQRPAAETVQRRADLNVAITDHLQGLADLLAAGAAEHQLSKVNRLHRQLQSVQQKMGALSGLQDGLVLFFTNLSALALLWVAIPFVERGRIDGVYLAVIVVIALAAFEAIQPLPMAAQTLRGNLVSFRRLREIIATPVEVVDPPRPIHLPAKNDLEITDLSFTYPGRIEPALRNIDIKIQAGSHVALVGESGSGKSTLLNLLLRFWEYHQGQIRLGGVDLNDLAQGEMRERLAVLYQPVELFNTSIRENLLLANPHAADEELIAAAQAAEIHHFIRVLPQGYETIIGEGGVRWSAGERQRLALARAFLRRSPILILDEPTANLDALTEKRVLDNLFEFTKGRTLLIITHRLIEMDKMDEILVMQAGRIVERGTHLSLISRAGIYAHQVSYQNDWFERSSFLH